MFKFIQNLLADPTPSSADVEYKTYSFKNKNPHSKMTKVRVPINSDQRILKVPTKAAATQLAIVRVA